MRKVGVKTPGQAGSRRARRGRTPSGPGRDNVPGQHGDGASEPEQTGGLGAHLDLADLAGDGHRELVHHLDVPRDLVVGELAGAELAQRLAELDRALASYGSVLVAFSGGADSAFVLARAAAVLGPAAVVGATAVSASLPAAELSAAGELARGLGVRWETPRTDEMSRAGYRANAGDRCFFCNRRFNDRGRCGNRRTGPCP